MEERMNENLYYRVEVDLAEGKNPLLIIVIAK